MRGAILGIACAAGAAFGLSFVHPFGDPRVAPAGGRDTLLRNADMPDAAKAVLRNKCADCHSAETRWPVYASVAPGSWLMERDIVEARKRLDLSHWETLPAEKQDVLKAKIVQQARKGDMPPPQYRLLHWDAKLSKGDVDALSGLGKGMVKNEGAVSTPGDPARGEVVFEKRCMGCHALEANREGPRLAGVVGRRAGSVPDFTYSPGVRKLGVNWDAATLDRWLTDPDAMVPDNTMSISVPKAADRQDLIAFLKR